MTIIAGFREACDCAKAVLEGAAFSNVADAARFRQVRYAAARQRQRRAAQSHPAMPALSYRNVVPCCTTVVMM